MLTRIENLPPHIFGVKATGEVTEVDLKEVLLPGLQAVADEFGSIHYLLVLDTKVEQFTPGAWIQDMIAGLKHFTKWKKMAVVTDQKAVRTFTDLFSYVSPGVAKGYTMAEQEQAIAWLSLKE